MAASTIEALVKALAQVVTQTNGLADRIDELEALAADPRKSHRLPKAWASGTRVLALSCPADDTELAQREQLLTQLRVASRTKGVQRKLWAGPVADALEAAEKWRTVIAAAHKEVDRFASEIDDRSRPIPERRSGKLTRALVQLRNIVRAGSSTRDDEPALPPLRPGLGNKLRGAVASIQAEIIDLNNYRSPSDDTDLPSSSADGPTVNAVPLPQQLPDHPSLHLFEALNGLNMVCHNAPAFRSIAEQRAREHHTHLELLRALSRSASRRANEQLKAGAKPVRVIAKTVKAAEMMLEGRPPEPPAELPIRLTDVLSQGRVLCERARKAIRVGGADAMDAALSPGGRARSTELMIDVGKANALFTRLELKLKEPRVSVEDDVDAMVRLGELFARARDELGAVLERGGLPATTKACRGGRSGRKRSLDDVNRDEERVRDYVREQRGKGVPIERITRDGIAAATGVSGGVVSRTPTWLGLRAEKRQAAAATHKQIGEPSTPSAVSSDIESGAMDARINRAAASRDWAEVLAHQKKEQARPQRRQGSS